ncbi:MAG TPA: OmpA family protein [Pirellulaceae bacterium]|nr:OmpA family protein [Pirellulaceae bacterium]
MTLSWMRLSPLALLVLISLACSNKTQQPAQQANSAQLTARPAQQTAAPASNASQQQLAAMQAELAARDAKIKELEAARAESANKDPADPKIAGVASTYDKAKRELTVTLQSDILFAPGSADIRQEAKPSLDKVAAAVKKDYAGKKIRVQGHTDKDPIVRSTDKWIDNMDLSQNRAGAVARYLMLRGVDMKSIVTVGFGDTQPKASKAQSRRVEIVVVTD